MKRASIAIMALGMLISAVGCRPQQRPGGTPAAAPTVTAMRGEISPAPTSTPTPAWPGWGEPVPTSEARISPENVQRLRPVWRAHVLQFQTLEVGPDGLIGLTPDGLALLSPENLQVSQFILLPPDTEFLTELAVRRDGQMAMVYTRDPLLRMVDLTTGQIRAEVRLPEKLKAMAFLDGKADQVAILADGLRIWEPGGGLSEPVGDVPRTDYWGVFERSGRLALTVNIRGSMALWEIPAGQAALRFALPFTKPQELALHPEGRYAAVAGSDQVVLLRLDRAQGKGEVIRTLNLPDVQSMDGGDSTLAILANEGDGSRVQVFRWEDPTPLWSTLLPWRHREVKLDEARGRIYLVGGRRLEVRRLEDGQPLQERLDPPIFQGAVRWEDGVVALADRSGKSPDVALLDLKTGRIRWHQILSSAVRSLWIDPKGKWLAVALKGNHVEFLDLQDGRSIGEVTLQNIQWMGPDTQGRGLIGLWKNNVLLWPAGGRSSIWQRTLPVSPQSQLVGAISSDWIAVGRQYDGDSIWLLDHEGKIQKTIRNQQLQHMYDLSLSANHVVAYLAFNRDGKVSYEALVFDILRGIPQARIELKESVLTDVDWWADRKIGLVKTVGTGIAIARMEGQRIVSHPLEQREDRRIGVTRRILESAQLLAAMHGPRIERGERSLTLWFRRGGWLQVFDVDQRKMVWEKRLPYAPNWMELDPQGRWLILGGIEGYLEVWSVGTGASD